MALVRTELGRPEDGVGPSCDDFVILALQS